MSQSESNGLVAVALFTLVVPLMYIGFTYAVPIFQTLDLDTEPTVNDTISFQEDAWDSGSLNALDVTDSYIFPEESESGNWTSDLINVNGNRELDYRYNADIRNGNGELVVNAWDDNLSGEPDQSDSVELESGINSGSFDLSNYSSYEVVVKLEETAGLGEERPNLDSLEVDFNVLNKDEIGVSSNQVTPILVISYLAGILFTIFSIYVFVKISLES